MGNGRWIGFWADRCLYDIQLADLVEGSITQDEWGAKVKDYRVDSGSWDNNSLGEKLPSQAIKKTTISNH